MGYAQYNGSTDQPLPSTSCTKSSIDTTPHNTIFKYTHTHTSIHRPTPTPPFLALAQRRMGGATLALVQRVAGGVLAKRPIDAATG